MEIRKAVPEDMDDLLQLYEQAREYMHANGNPDQWIGYPDRSHIQKDLDTGWLYVLDDGKIKGAFAWIPGPDPCYRYITGDWRSEAPYWVLHRVTGIGCGHEIFAWAKAHADVLRIDTHPQNTPMRRRLSKEGFQHVGAIRLASGDWRQAWIWTR